MNWQNLLQGFLVILGLSIGVYFSKLSNAEHNQREHIGLSTHASMDHGRINVAGDSIIPSIVKLEVHKDPMSGWNLYLENKNFEFAPQNAGGAHIPGQGHAHIKVNGIKIARLYSNWYHIHELGDGSKEIEVTLNANSHAEMYIDEIAISRIIVIE